MKIKLLISLIPLLIFTNCTETKQSNGWERYFCNIEYVNSQFRGVLLNNSKFKDGSNQQLTYEFDSEMGSKIKSSYGIDDIAGNGSDFDRALTIMYEFAPRLTHGSSFDNSVDFNALSILDYSLDNPDNGVNCLNKSKAFMEIYLSLGIYARKVSMYPYNPLENENHVVVEIYSREFDKWIMLDPSSNTYCISTKGIPLSLIEIRDMVITRQQFTIVSSKEITNPVYLETYLVKNLFYLAYDSINGFGVDKSNERYYLIPENFDLENWFTIKLGIEKKENEASFKYINSVDISSKPSTHI